MKNIALLVSFLAYHDVFGFAPVSSSFAYISNNPVDRVSSTSSWRTLDDDVVVALYASPSKEEEEYDFEAGFASRLAKEGGRTGVEIKAAKKDLTRIVSQTVVNPKDIGLLSKTEWQLTVGFLVLVVVLATGTHFSNPVPFETTSNGEQLGFTVR